MLFLPFSCVLHRCFHTIITWCWIRYGHIIYSANGHHSQSYGISNLCTNIWTYTNTRRGNGRNCGWCCICSRSDYIIFILYICPSMFTNSYHRSIVVGVINIHHICLGIVSWTNKKSPSHVQPYHIFCSQSVKACSRYQVTALCVVILFFVVNCRYLYILVILINNGNVCLIS